MIFFINVFREVFGNHGFYTFLFQNPMTFLMLWFYHNCLPQAFVLRYVLYPSRKGKMQDLSSGDKLGDLVLQIGYLSHHLTSQRKSSPIQKPSAQIPKAFNQHGIAAKAKKVFRYKCFNIANYIAYLQWKQIHLVLGLQEISTI